MSLAVIDPLQVPVPTLSYLEHSWFCIFKCDAISCLDHHCHRKVVNGHLWKTASSRLSAFLKTEETIYTSSPGPVWVFTVQLWGNQSQVGPTVSWNWGPGTPEVVWGLMFAVSALQSQLHNSQFLPIVCSCTVRLSLLSPERFLSVGSKQEKMCVYWQQVSMGQLELSYHIPV